MHPKTRWDGFSPRGSVLLLSLWATITLAALGISQATRVSLETKWVNRFEEQRQAWYLAWTAVEVAASRLASDNVAYDALNEPWAKGPGAPVSFAGGTFQYQISDEESLIPLNSTRVPPSFTSLNDFLIRLGLPAQAAFLLSARLNANPAKPVSHFGELLSFPGVTPDLLKNLQTIVTLYGDWPLNINTASGEVLQILGLTAGGVNQISAFRNGGDGVLGTNDDFVFQNRGNIMADLQNGQVILPDSQDSNTLGNLINGQLIGIQSNTFRLSAEGKSQRHGIQQRVTAILNRSPSSAPALRGWYEN